MSVASAASAARSASLREVEDGEGARDGRVAKAFRLSLEEGAAVRGERADGGIADAEMAEGDAPAGAVIAERLLGLDHQHLAVRGEAGGGGKPRDAAANDQEIRALHGAPR